VDMMKPEGSLKQHDASDEEKNKVFRKLFALPKSERLDYYYTCAYLKKILLQGRLYLSKNFLCFYSNVFGYETKVVIAMADVLEVSKRNTAIVIPNAIEVDTLHSTYFFASFISRDHAFNNIKEAVRAYKIPRSELPYSFNETPGTRSEFETEAKPGWDNQDSKAKPIHDAHDAHDAHDDAGDAKTAEVQVKGGRDARDASDGGDGSPTREEDEVEEKTKSDVDQGFKIAQAAASFAFEVKSKGLSPKAANIILNPPNLQGEGGEREGKHQGAAQDAKSFESNANTTPLPPKTTAPTSPEIDTETIPKAKSSPGSNVSPIKSESPTSIPLQPLIPKASSDVGSSTASTALDDDLITNTKKNQKKRSQTPEGDHSWRNSRHHHRRNHTQPQDKVRMQAVPTARPDRPRFSIVSNTLKTHSLDANLFDSKLRAIPPNTKSSKSKNKPKAQALNGLDVKHTSSTNHTRSTHDLPKRDRKKGGQLAAGTEGSEGTGIGSDSQLRKDSKRNGRNFRNAESHRTHRSRRNDDRNVRADRNWNDIKPNPKPKPKQKPNDYAKRNDLKGKMDSKGDGPIGSVDPVGPVFTEPLPPTFANKNPKDGARAAGYAIAGAVRFPFTSKRFWEIFMANDSRFSMAEFHSKGSDKSFKSSRWQDAGPSAARGVSSRQIFFVKTGLSGPLGPKKTRVHKVQRCEMVSGGVVIESVSIMPDVPYGDYFHVAIRWVIVDVSGSTSDIPNTYLPLCPSRESIPASGGSWWAMTGNADGSSCVAQIWTSVEFTKPTWIKYQIKSFANAGVKRFVEDWISFAKRHTLALTPIPSPSKLRSREESEHVVSAAKTIAQNLMIPAEVSGAVRPIVDEKTSPSPSSPSCSSPSPSLSQSLSPSLFHRFISFILTIVGDKGFLSISEGISVVLVLVLVLATAIVYNVTTQTPSARSLLDAQIERLSDAALSIGANTALHFTATLASTTQLAILEAQAAEIGNGLASLLLQDDQTYKQELLSLRDEMLQIQHKLSDLKKRHLKN